MFAVLLALVVSQSVVDVTAPEQEMVVAVNAYRATYKLPPLKVDPILMKVARERVPYVSARRASQPMLDGWNHRACHMWSNDHVKKAGFPGRATDNLAMGYATGKEAVGGWADEDKSRNPDGHNYQCRGFIKLNNKWVDCHFNRIGVACQDRNYIAIFGRDDQ